MTRVLKEVTDADFKAIAEAAERPERGAKTAEAPGKTGEPGGAVFLLSVLLGIVWFGGVWIAAYAMIGEAQLRGLTPFGWAALAALAALPALMVGVAGATAREGARARAEARRLADAAEQLLSPAPGAEAATRRLALAVRGEISALDRALEQTLQRLKDVEGAVARQSNAVDAMANEAQNAGGAMVTGMERERAELLRISQDLNKQAQLIGESISRHTRSISDSARLAEEEVRAADEALEARISSFGAAAALITDRTQALSGAAQASAESALKLENALSNALDVLAKATHLTDAARDSAQAATLAANSTATSVRETTTRAVADAKRAADAIRTEASSIEKEAGSALERLRDAANSARSAAQDVRGAVEPAKPAAPIQRAPTSFMRSPAEPQRSPAPPQPQSTGASMFGEPARTPERTPERAPERPSEPQRPAARDLPRDPPRRAPAPTNATGEWTWRDLLSNIDEEDETPLPRNEPARARSAEPQRSERQADPPRPERPEPPRESARVFDMRTRINPRPDAGRPAARDEADPIARLAQAVTEPRLPQHPLPAAQAIERAGVKINDAFSRGALDRIATRARSGTQARRQAVRAASPDAVNAVADFLDRDANARQEAARFLKADGARIAELLGRGRATMTADATRVFLLIDAASA